MGSVPVKHHSKSKVGRRRSQLALKKVSIIACPNCKSPAMPHRLCSQCGKMTTVKKSSKKSSSRKEEHKAS